MDNNSVLVMIVGTGGKDNGNYSDYLDVLMKAINEANTKHAVLVYSQNDVSSKIVKSVSEKFQEEYKIDLFELPEKDMEFHVDDCYKAFDVLLKKYDKKQIILDITHGTKAMSAALYAVGLHYDIKNYQYGIRTENNNGDFISGAEVIRNFDASYARWQGIFKQCRTLFAARQYAAVKEILIDEKCPKTLKKNKENCEFLSEFCAAWDRLDYESALRNIVTFSIPLLNYKYDEKYGIEDMLKTLTKKIKEPDNRNGEVLTKEELSDNIKCVIYLMFDLYANGLRRLDNAQYEDAEVRAYRIAEMLGQLHLMRAGYMPNYMSKSDELVQKFADEKHLREPKNDIYEPLGRKKVIEFLKFIGYDSFVVNFLQETENRVEKRNNSILIHGYKATAIPPADLKKLFDGLIDKVKFFVKDEVEFNRLLQSAMFLNNNFKVQNDE